MELKEIEKIAAMYSDPTIAIDGECRILFFNEGARARFGIEPGAAPAEFTLFDCVSDSRERVERFVRSCMRTNERVRAKLTPRSKDDSSDVAVCIGTVVRREREAAQNWVLIRCAISDSTSLNFPALTRNIDELKREIRQRRAAEHRIATSLAEKEVLLKEIHHRVKNNLQIISSLLNLQAYKVEDVEIQELFSQSQNRVAAMALIHEKLYRSENLAEIDFGDYLQSLVDALADSFDTDEAAVKMEVAVDGVALDINSAIPCALIVNELVSNALKYAFRPDTAQSSEEPTVRVEMKHENSSGILLSVSDNGCGFPEEIDFRNSESLGLQIVNTLVEQLDGSIELDNEGGVTFALRLRNENLKVGV